tara:strand:+ start:42 stop:518 length:477 start_codon:yes stop_codon:yes gene_type:complete
MLDIFSSEYNNIKLKKCVGCKVSKPLTKEYFGIVYRALNGKPPRFTNKCNSCMKVGGKLIREWKKNNPLPENHSCPICGCTEFEILEETGSYQYSNINRGLMNVDHDHERNIVRGWICTYCNNMLARARDNAKILINGALYLFKFELKLMLKNLKEKL